MICRCLTEPTCVCSDTNLLSTQLQNWHKTWAIFVYRPFVQCFSFCMSCCFIVTISVSKTWYLCIIWCFYLPFVRLITSCLISLVTKFCIYQLVVTHIDSLKLHIVYIIRSLLLCSSIGDFVCCCAIPLGVRHFLVSEMLFRVDFGEPVGELSDIIDDVVSKAHRCSQQVLLTWLENGGSKRLNFSINSPIVLLFSWL